MMVWERPSHWEQLLQPVAPPRHARRIEWRDGARAPQRLPALRRSSGGQRQAVGLALQLLLLLLRLAALFFERLAARRPFRVRQQPIGDRVDLDRGRADGLETS